MLIKMCCLKRLWAMVHSDVKEEPKEAIFDDEEDCEACTIWVNYILWKVKL